MPWLLGALASVGSTVAAGVGSAASTIGSAASGLGGMASGAAQGLGSGLGIGSGAAGGGGALSGLGAGDMATMAGQGVSLEAPTAAGGLATMSPAGLGGAAVGSAAGQVGGGLLQSLAPNLHSMVTGQPANAGGIANQGPKFSTGSPFTDSLINQELQKRHTQQIAPLQMPQPQPMKSQLAGLLKM